MARHDEENGQEYVQVSRALLLFWQVMATTSLGVLVGVLGMIMAFGRTTMTRAEVESYVSQFSPYALDKSEIQQQNIEQNMRLNELERKYDEMSFRQAQVVTILEQQTGKKVKDTP